MSPTDLARHNLKLVTDELTRYVKVPTAVVDPRQEALFNAIVRLQAAVEYTLQAMGGDP